MQLVIPNSQPLGLKTNARPTRNLRVHFKLPVFNKASPTVSVTNTNAARADTVISQQPALTFPEVSSPSSIPFPSSPIPCPSRKRAISEDGYDPQDGGVGDGEGEVSMDVDEPEGSTSPAFHRRTTHNDILRRRSRSCLAASYFHSDTHSSRKTPSSMSSQPPTEGPARKRPAVRRESMSVGNPTRKTARKAKRVFADAQFLASLHTSIASQVRMRMSTAMAEASDEYAAQDALLVERIWQALIDMGYKPIPLEDTPPSPAMDIDPVREAAERAARRTSAAAVSAPLPLHQAQELPVNPTGTMPATQLVAVLTMRHRDRTTTRPRSASKKRGPDERPSRSPLVNTFIPPSPGPTSTF